MRGRVGGREGGREGEWEGEGRKEVDREESFRRREKNGGKGGVRRHTYHGGVDG